MLVFKRPPISASMDDFTWKQWFNSIFDNFLGGSYTPTLYNTTNVAASTAYNCFYTRIGTIVTVTGNLDVDPTLAAPTATQIDISLPIATTISNSHNLAGIGVSESGAGEPARIYGDVANNRASMLWNTGQINNHGMSFTFTYQLV